MENTATQSSLGTREIETLSAEPNSVLHEEVSSGGRGHVHTGPRSEESGPAPAANRTGLTIGLVIVAVLLGAAIFEGIHARAKDRSELNDATQVAAVPTVFVTKPSGGSAAQEITLPGNTQAFTDTPIYARTSGYLRHWYADIGAHVRKGQLLADIETPELDQQLLQAQAELLSVKANMDLAQTTSVRWQGLLEKHAVSKQETDQVVSDYAAKQAAYASSQANVRRLQELQSYERVLAPFDGIITARNTDIGALIGTGSGSTPKELFHEAAVGKLLVYVAVPEVYADKIRDGQQVTITQDANPGQIIEGTISRNSNAIDQTSRTLNVQVGVDNASGQLKPGAYVFVHMKLPSSGTHTFTIPSNTLLFRAEGLRVGVVRNGVVTLVPITIGHDFGSTVEVTSGLSPDDQIVLDPSDSLISGTKVDAKPAKKESAL
ncbi:RND family efflux transporter, MFP subunit [Granulicella pectinivorans]|jgi:RND family efflux transporter MFP subunit|uniref:RND family efflux transporter, MFP subunit n=1 Tax=Granulicella pectinivorans TaxID=474950 RepID=A0A1I6LTL5_9BACT|nr:efflux RND transporter periplasmic adaptor subunit [Granulicella pectinivorans]SFS06827.1 RND family efflux transporter, MFP subunit [Granulicella pectinivorans]